MQPPTEPPPVQPRRGIRRWQAITAAVVAVLAIGVATVIGANQDQSQPAAQEPAAVMTTTTATSSTTTTTTTTTTMATPTTTPAPPPQVFTGKGDDVVKIQDPGSLGIITFECPKCSRNTVLETNGGEGLLVNEIGPYVGKRWVNVRDGNRTTELTVKATGSWKITVGDLTTATVVNASEVKGRGDDVVMMMTTATTGIVTHQGKHNFAVHVFSQRGLDMVVNEIGSYAGTVPMRLPALVQVTADGDWMIVAGT